MKKLAVLFFLLCCTPAWAAHYYVGTSGDDVCFDGLSQLTPFKTIARLNQQDLNPGDIVSFQGGQTFTGSIILSANDTGTVAFPVTLNSYGTGRATISSGTANGIQGANVDGITIDSLIFVGTSSPTGVDGISFFSSSLSGNQGLIITNVDVSGYGGDGIRIGSSVSYAHITIANSVVHGNKKNGITVYGNAAYSNSDVTINSVIAHDNTGYAGSNDQSGSGIVVGSTTTVLIENSEAYNNGASNNWATRGPIGIWVYDSASVTIQGNSSHGNHSTLADGGGFALDQNVKNSIVQNNTSATNDGPGYLLMQAPGGQLWNNNQLVNNTSTNDAVLRGESIRLYGNIRNATISGNTVSLTSGSSPRAEVGITNVGDLQTFACVDHVSLNGNSFTAAGPDLIRATAAQLACASNLSFLGNSYAATPFAIVWGATTYTSCAAWHTATGQENCPGLPANPPVVSSVTPNVGTQGQSLTVAIAGTDFQSGALCDFGSDIVVVSCTFDSSIQLTAQLAITGAANLGDHTLTITNPDAQSDSLVSAFTVTAAPLPPPTITSATPTTANQGDTLDVVLTGDDFVNGATCSFGANITVNSCTFNSITQLTANITIAGGAAIGAVTITVTNPDMQDGTLIGGFMVTQPPANPPTITSVFPTTGTQGQTLDVVINGTDFVNGATCSFGTSVTMNSCTFTSSIKLTANITIAGGAATGGRTLTVTNPDSQFDTLVNGFTITAAPPPAPTVTSLAPTTGTQGQTLSVVITGTGFLTGATCSFGASVTINSCTFNSSTQITANITIAGGAATGGRTLTVTNTDNQVGTLVNAFTITDAPAAPPVVTSATPNTGAQGATLPVVIAGTGFLASPTCSFGANVTINTCTRDSAIQITSNITIAGGAATGGRTITVTNTDTQTGSLANGFTITGTAPPAPTVTSLSPNTGQQGATVTTVLTGTGFQSGANVTFSGAGITVNSIGFFSSTSMFAQITIAGGAATTARDVTVTNPDAQFGTGVGKFTVTAVVNPAPTVTSATPSGGNQGATVSVTLVGTGFLASPTCNFGVGITVNTCVRNSATSITSSVTIAAGAASGGRTVTVTNTDGQSGSLTNGFTVIAPPPAPTVSTATPNSGAQGATLSTVIAGTNFQSGAVASFSGTGITVNSTTFNSGTQLTVNITIAGGATTSARDVTVTNPDTQFGTAVGAFTVTAFVAPAPTVTSVTPSGGNQGATVSTAIVGTGFLASPTCSFGVGITVNTCVRNSATSITSSITIAAAAASGGRTVTVTNTDGQSGSLTNGFTVIAPPPAPTVSSVTPNSGAQGATLTAAVIAGTGFTSGATCSFGAGITVNSCTFNSGTQLTANITISGTATVGTRTVTVTNPDTQAGTLVAGFTVTAFVAPAPTVTAANPNSGTQGQTLSTVITGTQFQSGATCSFGVGITVNTCTFGSSTSLTANITIAAAAATGARTVTVTNPDAQSGSKAAAFTVLLPIPPAPTVTSTSPNSGAQGATLVTVITGTGFLSGATCSFGAGITVNSCTFTNATHLSANITIDLAAATGTRTVTVTNPDAQQGSAAAAFTVTAFVNPVPTVTSVSPASGNPSQTIASDIITGTGFLASLTCSYGTGITVNSCTRNSATQATANITIAASAASGGRTVTVTNTDGQSGSLANAFTVIIPPPAPTVTAVSPTSGSQGQSVSVVITGTAFQSGATSSFGAGITVNSTTFNSATQLTASITIAGGATLGVRTVTVTNPDTQTGSLVGGFTVTAVVLPPPTVTSVTPNAGSQGQTITTTIVGTNFVSGATCSFGAGITVNSCTFTNATHLTASLTISSAAALGSRTVIVTNPDAQSGSLGSGFTVNGQAVAHLLWNDNSTDETGFKIQRSDDGAAYFQVGSVNANVTMFDDATVPTTVQFCYQVITTNANNPAGSQDAAAAGGSGAACAGPISPAPAILQMGANAGSGTTVTDSSGNGFTGTWNGAWIAHSGYGSSLNSTATNNRLLVPGLTTHATKRTWGLWAFRNTSSSQSGWLFSKTAASVDMEDFYFDVVPGTYRFLRAFSGNVGAWTIPAPSTNVWHYLAVAYDSSLPTNVPTIWVDGVVQTVTTSIAPIGTAVTNTDAYQFGNRGNINFSWPGMIDEMQIWNRKLTTAEVVTAMSTPLP